MQYITDHREDNATTRIALNKCDFCGNGTTDITGKNAERMMLNIIVTAVF